MPLLAELPFLAASERRGCARLERAPSPIKNRVWGFSARRVGRLLSSRPLRRRTAIGYRGCGYKTALGRGEFLSPDPLGHAACMDLYSYANNDPVNNLDPDGRIATQGIRLPQGGDALMQSLVSGAELESAIGLGTAPQGGPTGSSLSSVPSVLSATLLINHPDYNPIKWNDGGSRGDGRTVQGNTNCYAYACNQVGPFSGGYGMNPGNTSGTPITTRSDISVTGIRSRSIADGLSPTPIIGGYPVYLVVAPGIDYHWYRQDSNGDWSHKPGSTPVTNVDASGNRISDPGTANHSYPSVNYKDLGGYLWVPAGFHF